MKRIRLFLTVLLLGPAPLLAQESQRDFDRHDLNGDGQLSMAEARKTGLIDRFDAMDTSRDGRVSRQEYQAAQGKTGSKD